MVSQEKAARAEVSLESMRAERDQLRSTEARLLREQESLQQEQGSQARILANLQMMQLNLDRMDAERKEAASSKVGPAHPRYEHGGWRSPLAPCV